jgi:hypothetical protein
MDDDDDARVPGPLLDVTTIIDPIPLLDVTIVIDPVPLVHIATALNHLFVHLSQRLRPRSRGLVQRLQAMAVKSLVALWSPFYLFDIILISPC